MPTWSSIYWSKWTTNDAAVIFLAMPGLVNTSWWEMEVGFRPKYECNQKHSPCQAEEVNYNYESNTEADVTIQEAL